MPGAIIHNKSWNNKNPSNIRIAVIETDLHVNGHLVTVSF